MKTSNEERHRRNQGASEARRAKWKADYEAHAAKSAEEHKDDCHCDLCLMQINVEGFLRHIERLECFTQ